ncbi:MAG: hypothetical protein AAB600_00890 [Patescibacteria group bacterium]
MKIQDFIFLIVFLFLVIHKNPKMMVWGGITCLVLSIPLFSFWIFFTAERLTWYAAAFFLLAIIFYLLKTK